MVCNGGESAQRRYSEDLSMPRYPQLTALTATPDKYGKITLASTFQ